MSTEWQQVDGVCWAKRIHMSTTLARLGLKLAVEQVDQALVAIGD